MISWKDYYNFDPTVASYQEWVCLEVHDQCMMEEVPEVWQHVAKQE